METSCHISSVLREFETVDDMCIKSHLEKIEQQQKECIYHNKVELDKLDFLINFMTGQPQPHHSLNVLDSYIPLTSVVAKSFSVNEVDTSSPLPKDQPPTIQPVSQEEPFKTKAKVSLSKSFAV